MTTSKQHMEAVERIAQVSSTNEKLVLLKEAVDSLGEPFLEVLRHTYDPFITYGVKKIPEAPSNPGKLTFDKGTWLMLNMLSSRALSGHVALQSIATELARLEPSSQELLRRILQRDLRAGIADTSINKVSKGLIPTSPYMRCSLKDAVDLSTWEWEEGVFSQIKADGRFNNINRSGETWLSSRSGQRLPSAGFEDILALCEGLKDNTQTHGEMLVVNGKTGETLSRKKGNGIINSVAQGGRWPTHHYPVLRVWDQIPIECAVPKGKCDTPYKERFASLSDQALASDLIDLVEGHVVYSLKEAYQHCRKVVLGGGEGTIIKRPSLHWRDSGSSGDKGQVKLKVEAPCELEILDFLPGDQKGKHAKTFGSLLCATSCRKLVTGVAGITDKLRETIHNNRETWRGGIITVIFNDILYSDTKKPHSLFLPRYEELREDKAEADTFERVIEQYNDAIGVRLEIEAPAKAKRITRTRKG